ncbi:MAG: hypothetical protein J6Q63_05260 [Bacteroidales bacterium]|nr:hypothetical protein [Bacteroidales bacterium]
MKKNRLGLTARIDRIISGGVGKQILCFFLVTVGVIIIFLVASLLFNEEITFYGLGSGEYGKFCRMKGLLYHFIDPGNISIEKNNGIGAQIFVVFFTIIGMVFLGGLLITTLTNIVERRVSNIEEGKVVYSAMKNHYVIIGHGDITTSIIQTIYGEIDSQRTNDKGDYPPILILTCQDIKTVRAELLAQLASKYEKYIFFYSGNLDSQEHIRNLNIDKAKEVYVLGEQDEYGRDSKNLECVKTIAQLRGKGQPILTVNVQFDKLTSYSIIQKITLSDEFLTSEGERSIYFRPFNIYENWAKMLWGYKGTLKHNYDKLDFENITGSKYVHLVIVGFSRMGRALLLEALRQCHYPNYNELGTSDRQKNKSRITVIDRMMDDMLPDFKAQYPYLGQIEDINIEYLNATVQDSDIRAMLSSQTKDPDALLTIAICLEDSDFSLSTGLCLPDDVFYCIKDGKAVPTNTRVLIRQSMIQEGIGRLLDADNAKYSNVHIFGMTNKGLCKELMSDDFAMYVNAYYTTCYYDRNDTEANASDPKDPIIRDYDRHVAELVKKYPERKDYGFIDWVTTGDKEEKAFMHQIATRLWMLLNEDLRFANRYQVDMYDTYLKYNDSPMLMQMEHLRWNADRSIVGYRSSHESGIKDLDFKLHKMIIPFYKLSDKEKKKDTDVIVNMKKLTDSLHNA